MRVAWLLLCCVLLEDCSTNLGSAVTSDVKQYDLSSVVNTAVVDNDFPSFAGPIGNVTAASGREAILSCTIKKLGNYKVGWLREKDQTILSMGQRTVTHSTRFFVSLENVKSNNQSLLKKEEETTWHLHIRSLREADRGCYMCQLNTKPMLNQLGCVDVLVAPDILTSGTSEGEVSVLEGENATLTCKASGRPPPRVLWRREKNTFILMRKFHDQLERVDSLSGERLELIRVDRRQMGAYLCIAINEVPPAVSKRVYLRVNFPPSAKVPNQLLGSPLDTDVSLTCLIEAFPKTINFWTRREQVIMNGGRYEIQEQRHTDEEWKTTIELRIRSLEKMDLGEYTCSATSSMGRAEATLRVYEIERATLSTRATSINWRKLNRGKSKSSQITTLNRVIYQLSTPSMQKSTSRLNHSKHVITTTADPRVPLIRDNNAFKHNDILNVRSNAIATAIENWMYVLCTIIPLGLR